MLEALISSKTRVKLLTLFPLNPERVFSIREIVRTTADKSTWYAGLVLLHSSKTPSPRHL